MVGLERARSRSPSRAPLGERRHQRASATKTRKKLYAAPDW